LKQIIILIGILVIVGCSSDEAGQEILENDDPITLASLLVGREVVIDNVIACAASDENSDTVSVYVYPRPNVTNIRVFGTTTVDVDKNDFSNYTEIVSPPLSDFLNGYLLRYEIAPTAEKWVVVTFDEDGQTHVANPVRLKQLTAPTEYLSENIATDLSMGSMPIFSWIDGSFTDSVIYFHAVTAADNELFSGTYTFERNFQYYKLDNVVLNITEQMPPPDLVPNTPYNFILLGVTEDSWVNLISEIPFEF